MDEGKNNYTWCWQCENWKEVLGHSEINCPNVVCRNCGLVGHIRPDCPHPSVNIPSNSISKNVIPILSTETTQHSTVYKHAYIVKILDFGFSSFKNLEDFRMIQLHFFSFCFQKHCFLILYFCHFFSFFLEFIK